MQKVTLEELAQLYRKVKVHLYEQASRPRLFKLLQFEEKLTDNLQRIMHALNGDNIASESKLDFVALCEGICAIPHRVENGERKSKEYKILAAGCDQHVNSLGINAIYIRVLADIPIECELVFALWLSRVGHLVDRLLGNYVFGNRLHRMSDGSFPSVTPALYRYYLHDKRQWHETISKRTRNLLNDGHKLLVVASELRDKAIISDWTNIGESDLGLEMLQGDSLARGIIDANKELTDLVIKMLRHWREHADLVSNGIPFGSVIAGLLLNVRLLKFDKSMCDLKRLNVLYYSRCEKAFVLVVDDMENEEAATIYSLVKKQAEKCFALGKSRLKKKYKDKNGSQRLTEIDDVVFQRSRGRVLRLHSEAGLNLLSVFDNALDEDRTVWQNMPEVPDVEGYVRNMYSLFGRVEDEPGLLNLNQPMLSRRHFTKQIQDMEQYMFYLKNDDWRKQRMAFLNAAKDMLLDVSAFVLYYPLFPRLLGIAFGTSDNVKSSEFAIAIDIIKSISGYINCIPRMIFRKKCDESKQNSLDRSLKNTFGTCVLERLCATVRTESEHAEERRRSIVKRLAHDFPEFFEYDQIKSLPKWRELLEADLADVSFKDYALEQRWRGRVEPPHDNENSTLIPLGVRDSLFKVWSQIISPINSAIGNSTTSDQRPPYALYFATRPLDVLDLYTIGNCHGSRVTLKEIADVLRVCNCKVPVDKLPQIQSQNRGGGNDNIEVPYNFFGQCATEKRSRKIRIALVSWKVESDSWSAMVCGETDPYECDRFKRLMHIVNKILVMDGDVRPHYLIFPELAIPPVLFMRIAKKLSYKGVSIIAGIDYLHCGNGHDGELLVENQVWCSLCCSIGRGCPVLYRYTKSEPAQAEASELWHVSKTKYRLNRNDVPVPFVISHGDSVNKISLSVLICSDLLDIERRSALRGRIDLLVVPAWNQDVKTYSALVDAAAYDIHTYVALCNSRTYGDTRLRSPAKAEYARDIVRLRGGRDDFFVVGEIDVEMLRRFQSGHDSCNNMFKPVPIGFAMSKDRRRLPLVCHSGQL